MFQAGTEEFPSCAAWELYSSVWSLCGVASEHRFCSVLHCSYNPFDGPNENPEAELPLTAGKYLYVYGDMDEDGFYEGIFFQSVNSCRFMEI